MSQILSVPAADAALISLDAAVNPFVKQAVAYWRSVRGERRFPARADLTLRGMAAILPYVVIVAVIGEGADFEYRYAGEAQRIAFKVPLKGIRVTQIEAVLPKLGHVLRGVYEQVRAQAVPLLVRGRVDHEPANSKLLYHETAFLPLGADDAAVDHLLIAGVQIPQPYWDIPPAELSNLTSQIRAEPG
ncbi:MAG: PAS domain-containing protein [Rhizomicrobium sp.]